MAAKKSLVPKKKKGPLPALKWISDKSYRTLFEHAGLPTIVIGKDSIISLANRAFLELSGFRRQEIIGKKKWMEFAAPADIEKLTNHLSGKTKKTGPEAEPYSFVFVDRKKRTHHVMLTVGIIPKTQRCIFSFMEITEEERFEDPFGYITSRCQVSSIISLRLPLLSTGGGVLLPGTGQLRSRPVCREQISWEWATMNMPFPFSKIAAR